MLISEQLQAQVRFTATDQDLAQVILQDPHAVLGKSMQSLAKRAHCSHSAVIRLCQKLGFKGYRDFSLALT
jgi:RpiR family carbohydrate utilization transcriptional regulator